MEAREFSISGTCMPSSGNEDTSLAHSGVRRQEMIPKLEDVSIEADAVTHGGEVGSGPAPVDFEGSRGKKKRGRPPRAQPKMPPTKKAKDEEDVCFICFDGGNLVLCDRRGCPKAYHPTCIKRKESFFRSKSKWNCGWHTCSTCQKKASHYMCLTCTYSLCRACTRGADYVCVRENKGFCSLCMKMIMLIESKDQRDKVQIDFDDKTSWEYLFKMYWLYIKDKLSLTLDELTKAKSPRKAAGTTSCKGKDLVTVSGNKICGHPIVDARYECKELDVKSNVINQQIKISNDTDSPAINTPSTLGGAPVAGSTKWASKELLAFVAHIKNGDTSVLSLCDVQILLQGYVQKNKLHDPNHKSQIICDTRLVKLFGKPRVGHFEMLKLLEFHFPLKDESLESVSLFNIFPTEPEGQGNREYFLMASGERKRKNSTMGERGQSTDLTEYAAIDVHNISMIYLRRHLLENLVNDIDKFHEMVVGSIVRTRFFDEDHKQDMYGLVQVIGTCKSLTPYKLGEKMVDVVLEILNMDKKVTISIDAISNEEFSEEECGHLRESIKRGLGKHLTVSLMKEKAKALREVIVKDWLEIEVLRLKHLRDSAQENGHENKYRDYVEKLEVLQSLEERERLIRVIPDVHVDPILNPHSNSVEDAGKLTENKRAKHLKTQDPVFNMNARESIPSRKGASIKTFEDNISENNGKTIADDFNQVTPTSASSQGLDKCSRDGENDICGSSISERPVRVDSYCSAVGGCSSPAVISSGSFSGVVSENSVAGSSPLSHTSETENLWRYRDSVGEVQGPFCLTLLRKWNTIGLLPSDTRVWSIYNEEVDSLLLSEVVKGQLSQKLSSRQSSVSLPSPEIQGGVSENGSTSTLTSTGLHSKQCTISQNSGPCLSESNANNKLLLGDEIVSLSSNLATSTFKCIDMNKTNSPGCDSLKVHDTYSQQQPQVLCSDSTSTDQRTSISRETPLPESLKSGPDYRRWNSYANTTNQNTPGTSYGGNQSSNPEIVGLPSEQCRVPPVISVLSNKWDLNSSLGSETKSTPVSPLDGKDDILIKPCSIRNNNIEGLEAQATSFQNKKSLPSSFPIRDPIHNWSSSISNLVVGGTTFTCSDIDGEWCRYSPSAKASVVGELGLGLISVCSTKLTEPSVDHAAMPTCNNNQVTDLMPDLESGISSWLEMCTEPIESVSDLLDQVEAMQSQGGLPLPESAMNCVDYLFEDTENDYFCPIEAGLRPPALNSGKGDAQSSTADAELPPPHFEPVRAVVQAANVPAESRSGGQLSSSEVEITFNNMQVNWQSEASGSNCQTWESLTTTTTPDGLNWGNAQQKGYLNPHDNPMDGWGWMPQANANSNMYMVRERQSITNNNYRSSQPSSKQHDVVGSRDGGNIYFGTPSSEGKRV